MCKIRPDLVLCDYNPLFQNKDASSNNDLEKVAKKYFARLPKESFFWDIIWFVKLWSRSYSTHKKNLPVF